MHCNLFLFKMSKQQSKEGGQRNTINAFKRKSNWLHWICLNQIRKWCANVDVKKDRENSTKNRRFGSWKTLTISNMYNVHFARVRNWFSFSKKKWKKRTFCVSECVKRDLDTICESESEREKKNCDKNCVNPYLNSICLNRDQCSKFSFFCNNKTLSTQKKRKRLVFTMQFCTIRSTITRKFYRYLFSIYCSNEKYKFNSVSRICSILTFKENRLHTHTHTLDKLRAVHFELHIDINFQFQVIDIRMNEWIKVNCIYSMQGCALCVCAFVWKVSIEIMLKVKNAIVDSLNFLWARTNESWHKYAYTTTQYTHFHINICKAKSIYMRTGVFHSFTRRHPSPAFLRLIRKQFFWNWLMLEIVFPTDTDTLFVFFNSVSWYIACLRFLWNWTIFYTIAMATVATAAYGWRNCELEQNFKFILHRIVDKGKLKRGKKTKVQMEIGINLFVEVRKSIAK